MSDQDGANELVAHAVTVRFGGLLALDEVTVRVRRGVITGLIGPNGAGKSTLFAALTGLTHPTRGVIKLDERDITNLRPHRRSRLGIARTFQRLEVFSSLTVRENVLVAAEMRRRWRPESSPARDVALEALRRVGIADLADRTASTLPVGTARLVELARALACDPQFLLLDEPSSGLDNAETDQFAALLGHLADEGVGILLVEHNIPMVVGACEEINVLDFGQLIASGTPAEIQTNQVVQIAYLGQKAEARR